MADEKIRELLDEIQDLKMRRPSHGSQGTDNTPELLDEVNRLRNELARIPTRDPRADARMRELAEENNRLRSENAALQNTRTPARQMDPRFAEADDFMDNKRLSARRPSHGSQATTDYMPELLDEVNRLRNELAKASARDPRADARLRDMAEENNRLRAENAALQSTRTPARGQDPRLAAADEKIRDLLDDIQRLSARRPSHSTQGTDYTPELLDEVNRLRGELAKLSNPANDPRNEARMREVADENSRLRAENAALRNNRTPSRGYGDDTRMPHDEIRRLHEDNDRLRAEVAALRGRPGTPSRRYDTPQDHRLAMADEKIRELMDEIDRLKRSTHPSDDPSTLRRENDHLRSLLRKNSQGPKTSHASSGYMPLETDEDVKLLLDEINDLRRELVARGKEVPPAHLSEQNRRLAEENIHLRNLLRHPDRSAGSTQTLPDRYVDDTINELRGEVAYLRGKLENRIPQDINPALLERNKQLVNENGRLRDKLMMQPRPWGMESVARAQEAAEIDALKEQLRDMTQKLNANQQTLKDLEAENQMLRNKLIAGPQRRSRDDGLQSLVERLQAENSQLRNTLSAPSRSGSHTSEVPMLLDEINELRGKLERSPQPKLMEQNRKLAEENAMLRNQLTSPSHEHAVLPPGIAINDVNPALLERNRQLVDENNELRELLGDRGRSRSQSTRRDSVDQAEVDDLKDKLRRLQNRLEGAERIEQMNKDLENENMALRSKLMSRSSDPERMKEMQEEIEALKADNKYLKGVAMSQGTPRPAAGSPEELKRLREENDYLRGLALHHELVTKDKEKEAAYLKDDAKIFMDEITRLRACLGKTESPEEVRKLREQHDKLLATIEKKDDQEQFTAQEMEELRAKLQNLRKENADLRGIKSPDKLEYKLRRLQDENEYLKRVIERERADGHTQTEQHVGDSQDLHNRVLLYQEEVSDLKKKLGDHKQLASFTKGIQKELDDNLAALREECFHLRKQLQRTDPDAPRLTHDERRMFSTEIQRMNGKVSGLQDEVAKLMELLEKEKIDKTKATVVADKIADMSTTTKMLQQECNYLRGLLSDHEGNSEQVIKGLREEVLELKEKLKNDASKRLKEEQAKLTQRLGDLEEENNMLKQKMKKKADDDDKKREAEMDELRERIKELQEDNDYLQDAMSAYPREIDELKSVVTSLQNVNKALLQKETDPAKLKALEKELQTTADNLAAVRDENKYLKEQLHAASPQKDKFDKQAKEIQTLQGEVDLLVDKLAEANADNKYLKEQLITSPGKDKVEALKEEAKALKKKNEELQDENAYLKDLTVHSEVGPKGDDEETERLREQVEYLKNRLSEKGNSGDSVRLERLKYYTTGALMRGSAKQVAANAFHKWMRFKKGTPGSKWGLWEKERFDATRRKVSNVMLHSKIRNVAYAYYSKLARYKRPVSSKKLDKRRLADVLLGLTKKGRLQRGFNALRDNAIHRRREADNVHWLNVLWKTKQQATGVCEGQAHSALLKRYYNKLLKNAKGSKDRKLLRSIGEALLMNTERGIMRVAYSKLERYARRMKEQRRKALVRKKALRMVLFSTMLGLLRARWTTWREYCAAKREAQFYRRLQGTYRKAAGKLHEKTRNGLLKKYYNKLLQRTVKEKKAHDKTAIGKMLLSNTKKGVLRNRMGTWRQYADRCKQARREAKRREQLAYALLGKSKMFLMRRAYLRLVEYTNAKREEGFYWRQQKIMGRLATALLGRTHASRASGYFDKWRRYADRKKRRRTMRRTADTLLSGTKRGLLRRYYVKLGEYSGRALTDEGDKLRRQKERGKILRLLASHSRKALLRIYFNKLREYMRKMRRFDAKMLTSQALLNTTSKRRLFNGFVRLLAYAVHGRRRHTDMLWNTTVAPLRMVIGGRPENISQEASTYGKRRKAMSAMTNSRSRTVAPETTRTRHS
eukprot:TRINITY_DN808_c0_g2_i1.p1 TRINITY_DN808_c0_g2~~TRINITY_DN808_c0_g2_i1.p1  ORF type:complete len:2151 (+),score=794.02 TRINITY_DN808_c0_g2_i1:693-6455(+)